MKNLTTSELSEVRLALSYRQEKLQEKIDYYSEKLLSCPPSCCDNYISSISACQNSLELVCSAIDKLLSE